MSVPPLPTRAPAPGSSPARQGPSRRDVLKGAALLVPGTLLAACGDDDDSPAPTPPPAATREARFALAVLPDTQFYARYATPDENSQFQTKFGSEPFITQTRWSVENAAALNIPFLIHLGDVVDQVGKPAQWEVADEAMKVLEDAALPYSILAGNHDVLLDQDYEDPASQSSGTDAQRTLAEEPYLAWFPATRAARQRTFRGRDASGFHEYHVFRAEGQDFLVLSLSWRASDEALAWARGVIASNPTLPVILVNHQLLNIDRDGVSPLETAYGSMLWDKLIRDNDQIFMTLNGHHHGAAHATRTNDFGHAVHEMVVDYQMAYQGGNGLMRLYEFDLTNGTIDVFSFSPWVVIKPENTLNPFDRAELTESNERFTIAIDFAQRFAGFNPGFAAGPGSRTGSIIEQARTALLAGFTEPQVVEPQAPNGPDDYPLVDSTVAHWRFVGGTAGQAVPAGTVIADLTGQNPIQRAVPNAEAGVTSAQEADVLWSADRHYLSATPGSVQFVNTDKSTGRLSYFLTENSAPLNGMDFAGTGYTIEAFIKIDPDWTRSKHAWMNILTRDGQRGDIAGFSPPDNDAEASPVLFAVSSLREIQWEVVPAHAGERVAQASWSGEILVDRWIHIAVVANPTAGTSTMYIEGAPVLRNTGDGSGLPPVATTLPWVIGAGAWDGERSDGFFGSIGEIRICAAPLASAQWLTSRRV